MELCVLHSKMAREAEAFLGKLQERPGARPAGQLPLFIFRKHQEGA